MEPEVSLFVCRRDSAGRHLAAELLLEARLADASGDLADGRAYDAPAPGLFEDCGPPLEHAGDRGIADFLEPRTHLAPHPREDVAQAVRVDYVGEARRVATEPELLRDADERLHRRPAEIAPAFVHLLVEQGCAIARAVAQLL